MESKPTKHSWKSQLYRSKLRNSLWRLFLLKLFGEQVHTF